MLRFETDIMLEGEETPPDISPMDARWETFQSCVSRNACLSIERFFEKNRRETFPRALERGGFVVRGKSEWLPFRVFDRVPLLLLKVVTNFLKMYGFKGRRVGRGAIVSRNLLGKNEVNPHGITFSRAKGKGGAAPYRSLIVLVSLLCVSAIRENR